MADDLKISDMVEVTAGELHDDLQFEIIDPNEAVLADQNKRIKLVTLEASFGAEDKIFEGDSSVEVIDTGTGQVVITVDGNPIFDVLAGGLAFAAGARVDEIEATLTDDDTHLPTSGAVFDAIAGSLPDKIFEGNSYVEVVDAGTGQIDVVVDGVLIAQFTDANDLQLPQGDLNIGTADTQRGFIWLEGSAVFVGGGMRFKSAADKKANVAYFDFQNSDEQVRLTDQLGNAAFEYDYNGGTRIMGIGGAGFGGPYWLDVTAAGLRLNNTGARVDDIETTLTDDDTHLPTSGAVIDALAADVKDIISEGNTSVEVIDAGTGQIDSTVDGSLKARMNADGLQLKGDQTGAEAIGNAATTVAVTFGTAHADANYQVLVTVENLTDVTVLSAMITAKATTGFTATLSAATGTANYVLNWLVVRS